jgi:hypothetical protein
MWSAVLLSDVTVMWLAVLLSDVTVMQLKFKINTRKKKKLIYF